MSDVLIPRLPQTQAALQRKYGQIGGTLSSLPQPIANSLINFDTQRANRGTYPLSMQQTARVLASALLNKEATPQPQRGHGIFDLLGNAVSDVREFTSSIPRLPAALYNEVQALPQLPTALSQAKSPADILTAPGIRLAPGAYTLHNLLSGQATQLLEHPVFTALDIAPYTHAAAPKLLGTLEEPTRLGELTRGVKARTADVLGRTQVGQFARQTFGTQSREQSSLLAQANKDLAEKFGQHPAMAFRETYTSLGPERLRELTDVMERHPELIDTLSDTEQAFVAQSRDLANQIGMDAVRDNYLSMVDGEFYPTTQANRMLSIRQRRDATAAINRARNMVTDPTQVNPSTLVSDATEAARSTTLGTKERVHLLQGYANALDAAGFDATIVKQSIRQVYRDKGSWDDVAAEFANAVDSAGGAANRPMTPIQDIVEKLRPAARTDSTVARFMQSLDNGDYTAATKLGSILRKRGKFVVDGLDDMIDTARRLRDQEHYLNRTSQFSDSAVNKLSRTYTRMVERNAPARFKGVIEEQTKQGLTDLYSTRPNFDSISQYINEGYYKAVPGMAEDAARLAREAESSWQQMRAEGIDPVFVHRVTPERARTIDFPQVFEAIRTPTQARARTNDISPYVHDVTVALPHQALELLANRASAEYINTMMDTFAKSEAEVLMPYLEAARKKAGLNPTLDVLTEARRMMQREWTTYDPHSIQTFQGINLSNYGDKVMLPKYLAKNFEMIHTPKANRLTAVMDPVMKVFRTSLLPLSPRWHFNNILGGGMMVVAEDPRALLYLKKARDLIKSGEMPNEIPTGFVSMPKEVLEWNDGSVMDSLTNRYHFLAGKTLGRLFDEASKARSAGSKLIEKSYAANAFFDDTYRAAMYLSGQDRALVRGLSKAEARETGIQLARKVFQNWDAMTPIERSVMRYVFPFYGWTSHIMRYALQYPFDHPVRVAIVGSFARNEIADRKAGLDDRFLSSFFLGHPDHNGKIKAISLSGMNPFRDVANYMTTTGFLSGINPVIGSVLESLGIDPASGGAELFPEVTYDASTGRLTAKRPGIAQSLLANILPQSQLVLGLLGASAEYKQLARTNPEAASRLLQSQAGLPILFRNIPLYETQFKSELAREDAQQAALASAMKSGDYGNASRYPGLQALIGQIEQLKGSSALAPFRPTTSAPPSSALIRQALTLQLTTTGRG